MLEYKPLHPEYERPFTDEVIQEALLDRAPVRIDMMCEQGDDYFRVSKDLRLKQVIDERQEVMARTSVASSMGRFIGRLVR